MNYALPTAVIILIVLAAVYAVVVNIMIVQRALGGGPRYLIPVYGQYLYYSTGDCGGMFVGYFILSVVLGFISGLVRPTRESLAFYYIVLAALGIFAVVLQIRFSINLARNFNKSGGFAVGLIFLPIIFLSILAFGPNTYGGSGRNSEPAYVPTWKCPVCGAENPVSRGNCMQCGANKP